MHRPDIFANRTARGHWDPPGALPDSWTLRHGGLSFELKPTPFGHLGLFPEQAVNWDWITKQVRALPAPPTVLNLFAYTGGSTLAAARAGAHVVHVDAAANIIPWARRNAAHSGLADAPIRWITEDAMRFVRREIKRGNRYDAMILDPPAYGHGPHREVWEIERDFEPLLKACVDLAGGKPRFMLVTCHTKGYGPSRVARLLSNALGKDPAGHLETESLRIASTSGGELPCGVAARWSSEG